MNSQFIDQIQILMHAQQIKCAESVFGKSNYMWLCSKRTPVIWMSTKDEFTIRQALTKVTPDQQVKVMKQLLTWLDNHPDIHSLKIPEMSLRLLNHTANANMINELNFTRMSSFRNSLRRLSLITNRVAPALVPPSNRPRRHKAESFLKILYIFFLKITTQIPQILDSAGNTSQISSPFPPHLNSPRVACVCARLHTCQTNVKIRAPLAALPTFQPAIGRHRRVKARVYVFLLNYFHFRVFLIGRNGVQVQDAFGQRKSQQERHDEGERAQIDETAK